MAVPLAKTATPAAKSALAEATMQWPKRDKASDGLLPSKAHYERNPNSDHNDGHAWDLTHDPDNGCDAHALADVLRKNAKAGKDKRIKYIISKGRIASGTYEDKFWEWRPFSGNPHTGHIHVSIKHGHGDDTSAWFPNKTGPAIKPPAKKPVPKWGPFYNGRPGTRTVKLYDRGRDVQDLQRILNKWYPALSRLVEDGDFGPATEKRVVHFQKAAKIEVDGIVGPVSWRTLGVRYRG